MDTIQHARQVLSETETSLRRLMERGLKDQRYSEVAEVARLADGVTRLLQLNRGAVAPPSQPHAKTGLPQVSSPKLSARRVPTKRDYPQFERDGDRLVKIGWSKKRKGSYEHRAPRQVVLSFARHLSGTVSEGNVFSVENLLPVPDIDTGGEIPAYQVYLTLAWLQRNGAIVKKGRDGYLLRSGALADGALDTFWDRLPIRSDPVKTPKEGSY